MGQKLAEDEIARINERAVNAMNRQALDDLYDGVHSLAYAPLMFLTRLDQGFVEVAEGEDTAADSANNCVVKIIMTGSAEDGPDLQPHVRSREKRRTMVTQFKDVTDPFRTVIVRDIWLTGFDATCLHAMYADEPMSGM